MSSAVNHAKRSHRSRKRAASAFNGFRESAYSRRTVDYQKQNFLKLLAGAFRKLTTNKEEK